MPFRKNDPLIVEYINGICWKVKEDIEYLVDNDTKVIVPAGFVTDFASVPRLFWNIYSPTGGIFSKAALIHDYLYNRGKAVDRHLFQEKPITRAFADAVFLQAMVDLKVSWVTRRLLYSAVRVGGRRSWNAWRAVHGD